MPLFRVAWQTLASRFGRAAPQLYGHVPFRQMSSGSLLGSSRENLIYGLLAVGFSGACIFYSYRMVTLDNMKYRERIELMEKRTKHEWKPRPWPPSSLESDESETKEATDTSEEPKVAAAEESEGVIGGESQVQSEEHAESMELEKGEESPVEEATSAVPGGEQEAPANSEATQD
ncbi:uncharacterized protein LOC143819110 [Paroedura picta]|uniref:uncharacterized protein LOC143819110 n=1 Tax=Paroedura picta TaxID=143630 RepID=UPI0010145735